MLKIILARKIARVSFLVIVISSMLIALTSSDGWCVKPRGKSDSTEGTSKGDLKTERATADRRNLKWDMNLKNSLYQGQIQQLDKKKIPVDDDKKMAKRLEDILAKLKPVSLIPELPYEVHYVNHKTVNAVCYPGGGILFFKGLFDPKEGLVNPKSDDEIATVMAHEIAHATLRHGYKNYKTQVGTQIFTTIASIAVGSLAGGDWVRILNAVVDVGTGLYFPSYSRKHESQADLESLFMVMNAGYDPQKAIELWERAAQKKGGKTSIFSTHPSSSKRSSDLRQHLENLKSPS